jgi:uncharacterized protein DUF6477
MIGKTGFKPRSILGARADSAADSATSSVFARVSQAGAECYLRARDLPRLIALWPEELADKTPEGGLRILSKLRFALRAERRRGRAGHWSYELNRHLALLSAYKGELAELRRVLPPSRTAPGAARPMAEAERSDRAENPNRPWRRHSR